MGSINSLYYTSSYLPTESNPREYRFCGVQKRNRSSYNVNLSLDSSLGPGFCINISSVPSHRAVVSMQYGFGFAAAPFLQVTCQSSPIYRGKAIVLAPLQTKPGTRE